VTARESSPDAVVLPALHEALDRAALASLTAEHGDRDGTDHYLKIARCAGDLAFEAGSAEAAALNVILAAIRAEAALLVGLSPAIRGGNRGE
jgi:hypothetical protein